MQLVLGHLEESGEAPLTDLAAGLGMPLLDVAGLLNKLSSTGLVAVQGDPGREMVMLTEAGRTIAELA
jgi:DNA-binding MarR family transcriptional regulator